MTTAPQVCPACEVPPLRPSRSAPAQALYLPGGHELLRCPSCGLGWWLWPQFDPAGLYDRSYFQSCAAPCSGARGAGEAGGAQSKGYDDYAALEPAARLTARARLRRIGRVLGNRAFTGGACRLFEIGCGTGVFLDEARRAGWRVGGLEVSEYAAGQAEARGLDVVCQAVEDWRPPGPVFDCVVLWDVLEHLRDPAGALRRAAGSLRRGGVLALSTGDLNSLCARLSGSRWHLFTLPEHLFFFTPGALRRLLTRAGCRAVRVTRETYWAPLSYLLERLGKSLRAGRRPAAAAWMRHVLMPANLLDVLGVYALRR